MALGTITRTAEFAQGGLFIDKLSFAGDGAYPVGGTASFQALVRAKTLDSREVLSVKAIGACGGYVPVYDKVNDKLMVFEANSDSADGPLQESTTANLSGITFVLECTSK